MKDLQRRIQRLETVPRIQRGPWEGTAGDVAAPETPPTVTGKKVAAIGVVIVLATVFTYGLSKDDGIITNSPPQWDSARQAWTPDQRKEAPEDTSRLMQSCMKYGELYHSDTHMWLDRAAACNKYVNGN